MPNFFIGSFFSVHPSPMGWIHFIFHFLVGVNIWFIFRFSLCKLRLESLFELNFNSFVSFSLLKF